MAAVDRGERRVALVAGATGLVGQALLARLLDDPRYERVEVLARRPLTGEVTRHARLTVHIGDASLLAHAATGVSDVYIALGTTIKVAGSQAAFKAVDHDLVVAIARAARQAGATRLAVVSALGADAASGVFYNRVKGEMESAVAALGYDTVVVARPSLLAGDRAALGQPTRPIEVWATRLLAPVMALVPASVRPIEAATVAAALIAALASPAPGVRVLSSADMQRSASR
jgi:uncharacterized protein YbjT (DUF2867 family)